MSLRVLGIALVSLMAAIGVSLAAVANADADAAASSKSEHRRLLRLLAEKSPPTPYVVIDTQTNRLQLRNEVHELERDAVCATGAARKFEGPKRKHRWQFATPKGRYAVLRKTADPMWIKPEWAFVEADEEIPIFAEDLRRFQRGVLGEYALYFAKEYMIHGTLYEINLGNSITHGCVRVGTEDLQYLYDRVQTGWPVYIY